VAIRSKGHEVVGVKMADEINGFEGLYWDGMVPFSGESKPVDSGSANMEGIVSIDVNQTDIHVDGDSNDSIDQSSNKPGIIDKVADFLKEKFDTEETNYLQGDPFGLPADPAPHEDTWADPDELTEQQKTDGLTLGIDPLGGTWIVNSNDDPIPEESDRFSRKLEYINSYTSALAKVQENLVSMPPILLPMVAGVMIELGTQALNSNISNLFKGPSNPEAVSIKLKYKEGWTVEQKAAANSKVEVLNNSEAIKTTPQRSGTSASSRYKKANGPDSVPEGAEVDHKLDLQLGGKDDITNMWPLDKSVNRSLGKQIDIKIKDLKDGTRIEKIEIGE